MTVQLSLLLSEVAVTTAEPFLRAVTRLRIHRDDVRRRNAPQYRLVGGVRGAMEALRSAVLPRLSSSVCWLKVTFSTGMMSGSGRGSGRRGVPQFFEGLKGIFGAAVGVADRAQQLEQKLFFFAAQPTEAVGADGVDGQCAGGGIDLHHPHQLTDFR